MSTLGVSLGRWIQRASVRCCLTCLCFGWTALPSALGIDDAQALRLVPFPKEVRLTPGRSPLAQASTLAVSDGQGERMAVLLNAELERAGWSQARLARFASPTPAFRWVAAEPAPALPSPPDQPSLEAYALDVRPEGVVGAAKDSAGLWLGFQTLLQLVRANREGDALPCLTIRDWPSLRWRCFQDDLTRGPSSTLETLKYEASLGASLKFNLMTYYMEYQFAFQKHPQIGPPHGSLTADELAALVAYARPLHLDILGNQQSFGHFGRILSHPEFAALRETPDVLTPVREETYQLLDDLYSEVCPALPFPWFNVCCDETDGLGKGPSRELAAQIGVGGVYVRHLRRVHDLLRDKHRKRMMMWGDIILQHPAELPTLPKDSLMLTWGYDARASFEAQILPFSRSGFEFFVCPGVSDWSRILPDFGVAVTNIQNFVRDGARHGALGMINTDWEDDGEALKAVKWHADAWAAECAWNASATPYAAFNRRVGAALFGESEDRFGQAVDLLTRTHRLPAMKGMMNARFWESDFAPKAAPAAIRKAATELLALVQPAIKRLELCQREARSHPHILDVFLFGARRMETIGRRMLDGLEAAQLYEQIRTGEAEPAALAKVEGLVKHQRDLHARLAREFETLWLAESKPYALDWTLARYTNALARFDTLLLRLAQARAAAQAGQPLPAADEIGLAAPPVLGRRVRPEAGALAPPASDLPWAEASATHRLAVRVQAGAADRHDLPVEVELSLPPGLVGRPARAFLVSPPGSAREVLAQLDPLGRTGRSRLVFVLPGRLAQGTEAFVHLYLGLTQAPAPLPAAVRTSEGTHGCRWLENDCVRLLLGPEGAHIYRWELKAKDNLDLTTPGESDWAGFGDLRPCRNSPHTLTCTARGPAMVEYEAEDDSGQARTLRLYGGATWIEAMLREPTSFYWDYDATKTFAQDGPTPGQWLFSDGRTGPVGREAEGVSGQVKAERVTWGMKYNAQGVALGLITPETATLHVVGPGGGAGGVGIEGWPAASHFISFAGLLSDPPAETLNRLQATLDLRYPVSVAVSPLRAR